MHYYSRQFALSSSMQMVVVICILFRGPTPSRTTAVWGMFCSCKFVAVCGEKILSKNPRLSNGKSQSVAVITDQFDGKLPFFRSVSTIKQNRQFSSLFPGSKAGLKVLYCLCIFGTISFQKIQV